MQVRGNRTLVPQARVGAGSCLPRESSLSLGTLFTFFPIKIMVEPAHSPFALYPLKARIEKLWEASLAKQRSSPGGEAIIIFLYGTELAQSRSHGLMQISSVASDLFDRQRRMRCAEAVHRKKGNSLSFFFLLVF